MPTVTHKQERISDGGQVETSQQTETEGDPDEEMYDEDWAAKQIDNLVTLSNLPSSRWQHLLKLDVIKVSPGTLGEHFSLVEIKSQNNLATIAAFLGEREKTDKFLQFWPIFR